MKNNAYIYISAILFGMIGALIVYAMTYFFVPTAPALGTVNITGLVNHFIKVEAQKNLPPDLLKRDVKQYGLNLERELKAFATHNHIILVPTEAVISGAHDYTEQIRHQIMSSQAAKD